jgi:N-acetylglutamate synthase-like GNAT family acetyltransferase
MNSIRIIDYLPEHQRSFEMLNRTWIEKFFEMEPSDIEVLSMPDQFIIDNGGAILMAEYDGTIAGTVALKKVNEKTFEFTKMAVDENFRRKGIAEQLSYASFLKAKQLGAENVILYSNSILKGAIILYEKLGFIHQPVTDSAYKRSDVKMKINIADAVRKANHFFNLTENTSI